MASKGSRTPGEKQVVLTNLICLTLAVITLPYAAFFYLMDARPLGLLILPIVFAYFLFILMNRCGFYSAARGGLILVFSLSVFVYSAALGEDAKIQLLFFPISCLPIILFERKQWLATLACSLAPLMLALYLKQNNYELGPLFHVPVSTSLIEKVSLVVIPTTFFILFSAVYYLSHVSERSQAAYQEGNERFKQLTQSIEEVFWISDPEKMRIIYISPGYEKIWGRTCESLYANPRSFIDAIHPEDRDRVLKAIGEQANGKYDEEYRIILPDGSVRWIRDRASPVKNDQGEVYRICGVALDVTRQKEIEAQIIQQHSKIAAASKLSALGEMAGGIAHEINTPLGTVSVLAGQLRELIQEQELDREMVSEISATIEDSTHRIAKIIGGMRTFSRDGSQDRFETSLVSRIVDETLTFCQQRFARDEIDFQISIDPSASIDCRPVEISQVLLNVLNNAHDAAANLDQDSKWIRLDVTQDEECVVLAITNGGPCIHPEVVAKLFQPFFTTKEIGKGTGLGLGISREIVRAHRGEIDLDRTSSNTRFFVRLPKKNNRSQDRETGIV